MSVFRDMVRFQWHRAGHGDSGWPWMVRWMPLRGSRMGGWFVMMLLGLPAATAATLDSVQRIRSIGQAAFVVSRPPEGRAWPLPQAGANNSCLEGDARDVRWAVDGRWLAVEMSGRNVDSLCLYQLNLFGGALPQANIKVYRATGIQLGRTGATSITEEFKKGRAFQKSVAENEAQWIPEPLNDSARLSRYPARLVFSVAREGQAPRLSGLTDLAFGSASKAVWMDAQGDLVSPDTVMSTPVWRPATEGGDKTGLAALTTSGLSCGKQRLVYLRDPRCGGAASCPPPVELASACEKGVLSTSNSGVHYPSWSAGMEAKPERIAYVRGDPGKGWQVCVRIAPLANPPGPQRCFESIDGMAVSRSFPTWSADGRYLVYYEVGPARAARGNAAADEKEARLKGIDLQGAACQDLKAATCKPTTWVTRFRPNNELGARGPALLTRGGRTWAFVIGEKAATHTDVWAIPLDHPEERKVFPSGLVNLRSIDAIEVTDPVTKASEVRLALVAQGYDGVVGDRKDYDKVFVLPVALP